MAHHFSDGWPETWRAEMKDIRVACEVALRELDQHRQKHGC
jgi:hypothetical protein